MINGTSSNVKNRERMTYSKSGGGGGGRHSSGGYSGRGGDHHGGSNHHHGGGGGGHQQQHHQQHMQAPNSSHHAMAAFMNQSAMAALMHQNSYAALAQAQAHANHRSGGGGGHQSSLNYYGFPPFPSASDPSIRPYSFHHHQSPQSNAQSQTGHAPKVLYSKALQGSLSPTSGPAGPLGPPPGGIPPPGLISNPIPGNGAPSLVGPNLYHNSGGRERDGHHKSGGSHYAGHSAGGGGGGPNGRNMSGFNAGNVRDRGQGKGGPSYSNRHNQPYQNSRMPSNNSNNNSNTSSSSPPVTGGSSSGNGPNSSAVPAPTNGSTSVSGASGVVANSTTTTTTTSISATGGGGSNERANGSAVTTNGNGSTTPEGGKSSSLLSDHTDRSDHHYRGGSISKTNLYIRGLTPNTTDKDLHSLCSPYGNIISTKAILDKETNKCRGYGFVDFEHPLSAENAVKSLISQGVQAQMAKCSETSRHKFSLSKGSFNEHDPTNLYIANLPMSMTESDLEAMLSMYGSVISTRILKDSNGTPRGVGFARMESKEKCDAIINLLNGKMLPGSKDTLLVKFADGGSKKKHYKNNNGDRYRNDVDLQMNFDSTNMATNGVPTQLLPSPLGAASAYQRAAAFSATSPYQNALQAANPWLHQGPPQYIMQQMIPSNMDPSAALQYSPLMHQITAQMSHLQLGGVSGAGYMPGTAHAYGTQALYPQQLIQSMTLPGEESINPSHSVSSGSASGEEQQQQQQQQQQHTFQQMGYNQLQK